MAKGFEAVCKDGSAPVVSENIHERHSGHTT